MHVLVACEESQRVCIAFRAKGHEAYSCDIQECSGGHPEWHIKGDVLNVLNPYFTESDLSFGIHFITMDGLPHFIHGKWDLIIAHPPCTYLTRASACRMYPRKHCLDENRFKLALAARDFFLQILNANCDKICVENPLPLKCVDLPDWSQGIEPYLFDTFGEHPFTKYTCLWLKNLPLLKPTTPDNVPLCTFIASNTSLYAKGHKGGKGVAASQKERSKTFIGIAQAMADQWG